MTQWGLDVLFNPAKRHMDEEKQRQQSHREEVGDNSGGRRIDLDSGKVTIRRQDSDEPAADEEVAADDEVADATDATDAGAGAAEQPAADHPAEKPESELTPAQLRAAKRRGRTPR